MASEDAQKSLAMATDRISAAIRLFLSYDCEFRSKCSLKEASGKWRSAARELIVSAMVSRSVARNPAPAYVPAWKQDGLQHSTKPGGHFWIPAHHHSTPDFHSHCPLDCFARCPALLPSVSRLKNVVQVCVVCSVVWSHRILPDLLCPACWQIPSAHSFLVPSLRSTLSF